MSDQQKQTETTFHGLFGDPKDGDIIAPEQYLAGILKSPKTYDRHKFEAAKLLLPYRVPQLNRVDAVNRNVEMSHEDWINSLEDQEDGHE